MPIFVVPKMLVFFCSRKQLLFPFQQSDFIYHVKAILLLSKKKPPFETSDLFFRQANREFSFLESDLVRSKVVRLISCETSGGCLGPEERKKKISRSNQFASRILIFFFPNFSRSNQFASRILIFFVFSE